jgi:hypothetical protein
MPFCGGLIWIDKTVIILRKLKHDIKKQLKTEQNWIKMVQNEDGTYITKTDNEQDLNNIPGPSGLCREQKPETATIEEMTDSE